MQDPWFPTIQYSGRFSRYKIFSLQKLNTRTLNEMFSVEIWHYMVPYSAYYKPMGDLPYISSEQGVLIIRTKLIYEYTMHI